MASTILESADLEQRTAVLAAMSDRIRLVVLDELTEGEKCVCDLQEATGVAPSLLSYHLGVLRRARLVEASRRGSWVDYRLAASASGLVHRSLPAGIRP